MKTDINEQNIKKFNFSARYYDLPVFSWYFKRGYLSIENQLGMLENEKIISLGCGTGTLEIKLAKKFPRANFSGLDLSTNMINIAKMKSNKIPNIEFIPGESSELPYKNNSVDIVIILHAFHHFSNQKRTLTEIHRILKRNGKIYIVDPLKNGLVGILKVRLFQIMESNVYFLNKQKMEELLLQSGFKIMTINNTGFGNSLIEAVKK